ncbi:MAG: hypothetical protein KDG55_08770 [Rhodocyclaceae bacterium]|nr:hypothetical protein [Rhodocyclaceae bacterium]
MPYNQSSAIALLMRANPADVRRHFPGKTLSEAAQALRQRFNNQAERIADFAKSQLGVVDGKAIHGPSVRTRSHV